MRIRTGNKRAKSKRAIAVERMLRKEYWEFGRYRKEWWEDGRLRQAGPVYQGRGRLRRRVP